MTAPTQQLHSLLTMNANGLEKTELQKLLSISDKELDVCIKELTSYLKESGVVLLQTDTILQLAAQTDILPANIQDTLQSEQLSAALLEVLTIVAYHQPITQLEIETMRGIGSEQTIKGLVERNLIAAQTKKVDGISLPHYSTTQAFLAHLGITSLTELPPLDSKRNKNATE